MNRVLGSHLVLRGTSSPCTQFSSYITKFLMHPTNPLLLLEKNKKMLRDQIWLAALSSWELIKMSTQMQEAAASCIWFALPINLSHSHHHCCSTAFSTDQQYHNPSCDYHSTVCMGVFKTSPADHQSRIFYRILWPSLFHWPTVP